MWDLAVREADYEGAGAMLRRMKSPPPSMQILLAFASGDSAARRTMIEMARNHDSRQSQIAGRYVATYLFDFAAAESLARLDLQPRRRPTQQLGAQNFLAWLEVARGRWSAAQSAFAAAEAIDGGASMLTQRALAASLPFLAVPASDLELLRAQLLAWRPSASDVAPDPGLHAQLQPHLRLYLLGLLSARLDDASSAQAYAAGLEQTPAPENVQDVVRGLARTIRADVALHSGAMDNPAPSPGAIPFELVAMPAYASVREFTLEHERYLEILRLRNAGQLTEALRRSETAFQGSPAEIAFLAPLELLRGEAYERLGNPVRALVHYRRFVELWRACDSPLQPRVREIEREITRLERRTG
jgi:tetratricopeptide (TPR) repeat protein